MSDLKGETGDTISVDVCGSCESRHENLPLHSFTRRSDPWTHWYNCPVTDDPVRVCIHQDESRVPQEISSAVLDALAKAQAAGSFMAAVWRIENGQIYLDRVTQSFPTADFGNAIELLRRDLHREVGEEMPKGESVEADPASLAPLVNLFGPKDN